MSLQPILMLLGVLMISSAQGEDNLVVRVIRPPSAYSDKAPLTVQCLFSNAGTELHTMNNVKLMRTRVRAKPDYQFVGVRTLREVENGLGSEAVVTGELKQGGESFLSVRFAKPGDGYCYYYRCTATGKNSQGKIRGTSKIVMVNSKDGRACKKPAPAATTTKAPVVSGSDCSSCQAVKDLQDQVEIDAMKIQNNALNIQKLQALLIQASPLKENYLISGIFDGSVYLLSKKNERFSLESKNDQCKEAGGYLVELDSKEEQDFVAQFSKAAGRSFVYISANDVDKEGTFVQYNSKKPIPQLKWKKGEPNNYAGGEDCANINVYGLNDLDCSRSSRYLCEIPLM
ncbi:Cd209 antigen [Plakobranchus ocellatus]|uniref:Cd209 antigen n=1 Tax=Plakobranchus ocellatus TaxID=259542 RepID=A0AAV3XNH9_9GAST|nr:Cd209 antigen [Plakobranchus ocellatus]